MPLLPCGVCVGAAALWGYGGGGRKWDECRQVWGGFCVLSGILNTSPTLLPGGVPPLSPHRSPFLASASWGEHGVQRDPPPTSCNPVAAVMAPIPPPPFIHTQCCSPIAGRRSWGGGRVQLCDPPSSEHRWGVGSCPAPFGHRWLQSAGAGGGDSKGDTSSPHPPHTMGDFITPSSPPPPGEGAQSVSPPPHLLHPPSFLWGCIPIARYPHGCGAAVPSTALFARCVPVPLSGLARRLGNCFGHRVTWVPPPPPHPIAVPQFPL